MALRDEPVKHFKIGRLKLEIHPNKKAAGEAAAETTARTLQELDHIGNCPNVVFATGASQLETLGALVSIPNLPWNKVHGFHLDEYLGIDQNHPASFRRYLRENLTQRVHMKEFSEIDGNAHHSDLTCKEYARKLRLAHPQLCLL